MEILKKSALVLTMIGALNWGLIGIIGFNLVTFLFKNNMIVNLIYTIIGAASLVCILFFFDKDVIEE